MDSRHHALAWRHLPVIALLALLNSAVAAAEAPVVWVTRVPGRALLAPVDVAVDRRGISFLLDAGNRSIVLLSPGGEVIREIQGRGLFRDPMAVAVAPDGTVFVADGDSGRVLEFEMAGRIRHEYAAGKGSRVTGVAVFGDAVYCADNANGTVVVFKRGGGRTGGWGGKGDEPGKFNSPFRIAVDAAGRVFVTDVMNARVQWFSAFGQHLGTLKKFGAGEGKIFRPTGVFIDRMGRIWVSDSYTGLVQLFQENGTFVRSLGVSGRPFVFGDPIGVAEGPGGIWVADQRQERAAFFRK
ncbi:MAG TPA: NHL repeat-containing protein [Candidatus Deferrimicrobiaceae bacterium]